MWTCLYFDCEKWPGIFTERELEYSSTASQITD